MVSEEGLQEDVTMDWEPKEDKQKEVWDWQVTSLKEKVLAFHFLFPTTPSLRLENRCAVSDMWATTPWR